MSRCRICTPDVRLHLGLHLQTIYLVYLVLISLVDTRIVESRIFIVSLGQSIQLRVDSTAFGDTVIVDDGEYDETVLIIGKSMTLGSRYLLDGDTCHIVNTILRPNVVRVDTGSCIVITDQSFDSARTLISGFTCKDGRGTLVRTGAGLNEIVGGGIAVFNCNSTIEHCIVQECQAVRGAGIFAYGEENETQKHNQLRDVVIRDCHSEAWGGGANFIYAHIDADRCQFLRNESPAGGSAFYSYECSLRVASCIVDSNFGSVAAGLILGFVELDQCHFTRNATHMFGETEIDAAFCCGRIHHSVFENNSSPAACFDFYSIRQSTPFFESNVVQNCSGTTMLNGILRLSSSRTRIEHNLFQSNLTGLGPVIHVIGDGQRNVLRHNVFIDNRVINRIYGSVLFDATFPGTTIDSSWISNNDATVITGITGPQTQFDCRNNWWGHESGPYHLELNPTGQGDTLVGDDCEFIPWLTSPPDTTGWLPAIERERIPISKSWQLVNVFPNPFNSSVMIAFSGTTGTDFEISIHNLLGQKVDTITHGALTGTVINYTAPRELSSGVYFLVARDRVNIVTKKVVLLR